MSKVLPIPDGRGIPLKLKGEDGEPVKFIIMSGAPRTWRLVRRYENGDRWVTRDGKEHKFKELTLVQWHPEEQISKFPGVVGMWKPVRSFEYIDSAYFQCICYAAITGQPVIYDCRTVASS